MFRRPFELIHIAFGQFCRTHAAQDDIGFVVHPFALRMVCVKQRSRNACCEFGGLLAGEGGGRFLVEILGCSFRAEYAVVPFN